MICAYHKHLCIVCVNAITAPIVIFTQGFATSGFLTEMHQSVILVPAHQYLCLWIMYDAMWNGWLYTLTP